MDLPKINLGRVILSDVNNAISKEWLVTNGLGGYASSTVLGINTRKYHGLLVAALNPPINRWVLLTKLDEELKIGSQTYALGTNEFQNVVYPEGHRFLSNFILNPFPTYNYAVEDVTLQKTIFMPYKKNSTAVIYQISNPSEQKLSVRISPLVNSRHFYSTTDKDSLSRNFTQKRTGEAVVIETTDSLPSLILSSDKIGSFMEEKWWVEKMFYRVDASRGESYIDDQFRPGFFEFFVNPKDEKKFCILAVAGKTGKEAQTLFSSSSKAIEDIEQLYREEIERRKDLLKQFGESNDNLEMDDWIKWLIQAADSFIVSRASTKKKSVIAGYHWFDDWGRDALISLPGLTLITGRFQDAKEILLTFEHYCHQGVVPNRFSDKIGDIPSYNTVDATLWFFNAVLQYLKYTGDYRFVQEKMWKTLNDIIEYHVQGTIYGIHMENDGLLAHGPQLTWMDATTNGQFVTPRDGEAVEIQALWYNALKTMQLLAKQFDQMDKAEKYYAMAETARESFSEKFWNPKNGYLFDVVNKYGADSTLRPNQIIAISLDFPILDRTKRKMVVKSIWKKLWGKYGLKTLAEYDSQYIGKYYGDWSQRDSAYHNGTVWAWLLGPFTTAFLKTKKHEESWRNFAFKNFLQPLFQEEIHHAGLGTISEIFDGDEPHNSRGCISQAWSIAEPLRAYIEDVTFKRPPYERNVLETLACQ